MYMQSLIPGVAGCASYHIKHKHNCPAAGTISVNGGLRPPEEDFLRVLKTRSVFKTRKIFYSGSQRERFESSRPPGLSSYTQTLLNGYRLCLYSWVANFTVSSPSVAHLGRVFTSSSLSISEITL